MPRYEYQCDECDTHFELRRAMRDNDTRTECPHCHGEKVTRQVSLFMAFTKGDRDTRALSGGCGCGGNCACGSHSHN